MVWSRAWVPNERLRLSHEGEHQILATRPVVNDKGPGPCHLPLDMELRRRLEAGGTDLEGSVDRG